MRVALAGTVNGFARRPLSIFAMPLASVCWLSLAHADEPKPRQAPMVITPLNPGFPTTLEPLIKEALRNHPGLRSARLTVGAAKETPSRVSTLPDPIFGIALQNIRTDDPGLDTSPMSAVQIGLTQTFPFPGKLRRREALARAHADVAGKQLNVRASDVVLSVRRAYWSLRFAESAERITTDSESILSALTRAIHARYALGQGAQQDALQAEVEHSSLRTMLQHRRQSVVSARRALNSAVGRSPSNNLSASLAPVSGDIKLNRQALMRAARRANPMVALRNAQVAAARSGVDEARHDRWPDFQVGASYRFRQASPGDMSQGADMFGLSFAVTLPVWMNAKQSSRVRESYAFLGAAQADTADVTLEVLSALEQRIDTVERLNRQIRLYLVELLPEADQALDASIGDYQFGKVEVVSVLKNWEMQLKAKLQHAALLSDREIAVAEIDALINKRQP